jgi:hypothetical protein
MQCPQCGKGNEGHYMFCLGCGAKLPGAPAGEPGGGGGWPGAAPQASSGPRCASCGGSRTLPGAVGPQLGVRVFTAGRYDDIPLSQARVCVDCGHVALTLPEDARAYLAGLPGR